jgi:hypothetical protein
MSSEPAPPSIPPRHRPGAPMSRPATASAGSEPQAEVPTSVAGFTPRPSRGPAAIRPAGSPPPVTGRPATDDDELPSPLQTAVGSVTATLRKAAAATSTAFGTATHPRPEDATMTGTTNAPFRSGPTGGPAVQAPGPAARPATGRVPVASSAGAPRRVRLAVSRVDPWSVMKLAFLLSVALGIMLVVAVAVLWFALDSMHVFAQTDTLIREILGTESHVDVLQYVSFGRIISGATLVAVVDVFLLTALSTIGSFLYNITASLVGGVHLTLTDE